MKIDITGKIIIMPDGRAVLQIELPLDMLKGSPDEAARLKRIADLKSQLHELEIRSEARATYDNRLHYTPSVAAEDRLADDDVGPVAAEGKDARVERLNALDVERQKRVDEADAIAAKKQAEADAMEAHRLKCERNPGRFIDEGITLMED